MTLERLLPQSGLVQRPLLSRDSGKPNLVASVEQPAKIGEQHMSNPDAPLTSSFLDNPELFDEIYKFKPGFPFSH
jgi:hypothetical protein